MFPGEQEKIVLPEEIEDGREVVCPVCGGTMRLRGPFDDGRARHFYHASLGSGSLPFNCSGLSQYWRYKNGLITTLTGNLAFVVNHRVPEVPMIDRRIERGVGVLGLCDDQFRIREGSE